MVDNKQESKEYFEAIRQQEDLKHELERIQYNLEELQSKLDMKHIFFDYLDDILINELSKDFIKKLSEPEKAELYRRLNNKWIVQTLPDIPDDTKKFFEYVLDEKKKADNFIKKLKKFKIEDSKKIHVFQLWWCLKKHYKVYSAPKNTCDVRNLFERKFLKEFPPEVEESDASEKKSTSTRKSKK